MREAIISVSNLLNEFYDASSYPQKVIAGVFRDTFTAYKSSLFKNPTTELVEQFKEAIFEADEYLDEYTNVLEKNKHINEFYHTIFSMLLGLCNYLLNKVEE